MCSFILQIYLSINMVRTYHRTSDRCSYSAESLQSALEAIRSGMSKKKASATHGIPRSTLIKQLKLMDVNSQWQPKLGRFRPVFDQQFECELLMHVVELQNSFYGIGSLELRRVAYELAEQNGIEHPFAKDKKLAGRDWVNGFLSR